MKITLEMIAGEAGSSVSTVSRVLNGHPAISDKTSNRVLEAARKLKFPLRDAEKLWRPRRLLEGRSIAIVSLGLDRSLLSLPAVSSAINGAEGELSRQGARVLLSHVPDLTTSPQLLKDKNLEGIVVAGCSQGRLIGGHESPLLSRLRQLPTVWLLARPEGCWGDAVGSNDFQTGQMAADYLIERGHRRLAFLNPKPEHAVFLRREAGFLSRGRALGADVALLSQSPSVGWSLPDRPALTTDAIDYLVKQLLELSPRPTAVFAAADSIACGLYRALASRGLRVGEDLSVLAANNDQSLTASLHPTLTTFEIHADEIGRLAVQRLADSLEKPSHAHASELLISSTLVEGCSVATL